VLIEAMASGAVVVASASGAIPEVVGDAGLLVPEDDAPALAVAIAQALAPAEGAALRARAAERVRERYTQDVAVNVLYDALTLAAAGGTTTR
jgi:glycosyltransferase involved in cell wall biosynthesis